MLVILQRHRERLRTSTDYRSLETLAVDFAMDLAAADSYWRHQTKAAISHTEEGATPAYVLPEERQQFDNMMTNAQKFFDSIATDPPPSPPRERLRGFSTDSTGAVLLRWKSHPPSSHILRPSTIRRTKSNDNNKLLLWRAIVQEIANGWIEPVARDDISAAGIVFIGPKDRFLYDPEEANVHLEDVPLHYPRAADLLHDPRIRCAVKGDIKTAFRHIAVAEPDRRYLGIHIDGLAFRWRVLPFGLSQSPVIFARMLEASLANVLPSISAHNPVVYVDDLAIPARSPLSALSAGLALAQAMYRRGWILATNKWFLRPASILVFVGLLVDFNTRLIKIRQEKSPDRSCSSRYCSRHVARPPRRRRSTTSTRNASMVCSDRAHHQRFSDSAGRRSHPSKLVP